MAVAPPQDRSPETFQLALETMRYEGALLWQIFATFLVIHAVFGGLILQSVEPFEWHAQTFFAACIGLLLCVPWWASYSRNAAHYRYHLAKVRELEPPGWNLYGGDGASFSIGGAVQVLSERHALSFLARRVRSGRMIPPVILTFVLVYGAILAYNGPWWPDQRPSVAIQK